jgi:hypothetical protein
MNCRDFTMHLDDWLDGLLDAAGQRSIQEHLGHCPACRRRHEHAVRVQAAVRELAPPAPHPGFVDQAIARATRMTVPGPRSKWRAVVGMSLAASLVLGVAVGAFLVVWSAPVQTVALRVEQPENVRVMFNSAMPLQAAMLHLALPENLELVGYRDQRELTWQTDLREGGNLLQLPVIARGMVKDDLVARLSHGGSTKTFRVKFEVESGRRSGM